MTQVFLHKENYSNAVLLKQQSNSWIRDLDVTNQQPHALKKPCSSVAMTSWYWLGMGVRGYWKSNLDERLFKKTPNAGTSAFGCIIVMLIRFPTYRSENFSPPSALFVQNGLTNTKNRGSRWGNESYWVMCQFSKGLDDLYEKMWRCRNQILRWEEGREKKTDKSNVHRRSDGATNENSRSFDWISISHIHAKEWDLQTAGT